LGLVLAALLAALVAGQAGAQQVVNIYTHNDPPENEALFKELEAATGLRVNHVRMSSNELWARVQAEAPNVGADVQWGMPNAFARQAKKQGLLLAYQSSAWEGVPAQFKDADGAWYGWSYWFNTITVNRDILAKKGLTAPKSWNDLLDPKWKGEVVMPNPGTSGTAYLAVSGLFQLMGEEKGWKYLEALDKNVAQYTKSGSAPAEMVARGEYAAAITWDQAVMSRIQKGFPIEFIIPAEGTPLDLDTIVIFKSAKNIEAAKKVVDFVGSERGMRAAQGDALGDREPGGHRAEADEL
jgi:iron(III) transport system substrate-binding protein